MYFAYLVPKGKIKFVLVVWKRFLEWNKLAWVLCLCVHMEELDMEMQVVEEHTLVKEICR